MALSVENLTDSIIVSDNVGCGWIVIPTSAAGAPHFGSQHAFGDQFAGARADDADPITRSIFGSNEAASKDLPDGRA